MSTVKLTIDNSQVEVKADSTILEADQNILADRFTYCPITAPAQNVPEIFPQAQTGLGADAVKFFYTAGRYLTPDGTFQGPGEAG